MPFPHPGKEWRRPSKHDFKWGKTLDIRGTSSFKEGKWEETYPIFASFNFQFGQGFLQSPIHSTWPELCGLYMQ